MWNRVSVKEYAKDFLRKYYWKAFLVCLIVSLVTSSGTNSSGKTNKNQTTSKTGIVHMVDEVENKVPTRLGKSTFRLVTGIFLLPLKLIGGGIIIIMTLIFVIIRVTIGYALEVGEARFFLSAFDEDDDVSVGKLATVFNSQEYFSIVKTQFIKNLYNFLWYFAFVIPGIIKSYEYRFVPYILANEANLPSDYVIQRSKELTEGHKMEMFIMDISFIGWYILGGLLGGIGVYFVNPYKSASFARLYDILNNQ